MPASSLIARGALGLLVASVLAIGPAAARSQGSPYPDTWVVAAPSAATEAERVAALVTAAIPGYMVVGVAWSQDWRQIRHEESGTVTGRWARALVVLHDAAEDRCLLVEPRVRQDRSADDDGWGTSRLTGDNLKGRAVEDVPKVSRVGPDKAWWAIALDHCPATE